MVCIRMIVWNKYPILQATTRETTLKISTENFKMVKYGKNFPRSKVGERSIQWIVPGQIILLRPYFADHWDTQTTLPYCEDETRNPFACDNRPRDSSLRMHTEYRIKCAEHKTGFAKSPPYRPLRLFRPPLYRFRPLGGDIAH